MSACCIVMYEQHLHHCRDKMRMVQKSDASRSRRKGRSIVASWKTLYIVQWKFIGFTYRNNDLSWLYFFMTNIPDRFVHIRIAHRPYCNALPRKWQQNSLLLWTYITAVFYSEQLFLELFAIVRFSCTHQ